MTEQERKICGYVRALDKALRFLAGDEKKEVLERTLKWQSTPSVLPVEWDQFDMDDETEPRRRYAMEASGEIALAAVRTVFNNNSPKEAAAVLFRKGGLLRELDGLPGIRVDWKRCEAIIREAEESW
jgi:hypothetical protein